MEDDVFFIKNDTQNDGLLEEESADVFPEEIDLEASLSEEYMEDEPLMKSEEI